MQPELEHVLYDKIILWPRPKPRRRPRVLFYRAPGVTADGGEASVLIVIDVQRGFDDPSWGRRNNPQCEKNIGELIDQWRTLDWPIVFVRHDSLSPDSPLFAAGPGNALKLEVRGEPDLMVAKHTNSAFYGTPDLHQWLTEHKHDAVTICGITTNHCCETTARMAPACQAELRPAVHSKSA